jgi:hypothetical protein
VRDRHAGYFADQTDTAYARYATDDQLLASRWVDIEITNLAAAFDWALTSSQVDAALRIATNAHHIARSSLRTERSDGPNRSCNPPGRATTDNSPSCSELAATRPPGSAGTTTQ